jgi:hypothetical protein
MTSWYSIQITDSTVGPTFNTPIFDGFFRTNDTTFLVEEFYETIAGNTNFNNNIIVVPNPSALDAVETANNPTNTGSNVFSVYVENDLYYDQVYFQGWLTFDFAGVNVTSMSHFSSITTALAFNLCADSPGSQTLANDGFVTYSEPALPSGFSTASIHVKMTITLLSSSPIPPPVPAAVSNICFPKGTLVKTDQGEICIDEIIPNIHTIRNKRIVAITKTVTMDDHLVCFERHALDFNVPSRRTLISKNHKILHGGRLLMACEFNRDFVRKNTRVNKVKYTGELLYNVLMEEHGVMTVNNMTCETLHPKNVVAQLYPR